MKKKNEKENIEKGNTEQESSKSFPVTVHGIGNEVDDQCEKGETLQVCSQSAVNGCQGERMGVEGVV